GDQPEPGLHRTTSTTSTTGVEQPMFSASDIASVLKASQAIASEIVLDRLLTTLMKITIENAGAQKGFLLLARDGQLAIEAEGGIDKDDVAVLQTLPLEASQDLPAAIVHYVERTRETVVLSDATQEDVFATDPYIIKEQPKSILCAPLVKQGKLSGILYLENNLTTGAFTSERLEVLNLLAAEAAISIENAQLYKNLEEANERLADHSKTLELKIEQRTQELQERNR